MNFLLKAVYFISCGPGRQPGSGLLTEVSA